MDSILRALAVYVVLLVLFRLAGKRTLAEVNTFDAVMLLIISEAVQQALIDGDESMTNAFLLVTTLLTMNVIVSILSSRSVRVDRLVNDAPIVVMHDGKLLDDRMRRSRITVDDILEQARSLQGIERLDQIKYAVLERGGAISVVPRDSAPN